MYSSSFDARYGVISARTVTVTFALAALVFLLTVFVAAVFLAGAFLAAAFFLGGVVLDAFFTGDFVLVGFVDVVFFAATFFFGIGLAVVVFFVPAKDVTDLAALLNFSTIDGFFSVFFLAMGIISWRYWCCSYLSNAPY